MLVQKLADRFVLGGEMSIIAAVVGKSLWKEMEVILLMPMEQPSIDLGWHCACI